jgi:hypothetical protein
MNNFSENRFFVSFVYSRESPDFQCGAAVDEAFGLKQSLVANEL